MTITGRPGTIMPARTTAPRLGSLTWRDAVATLFVGTAVAVSFAATRGWDWPLVGSVASAGGVMGLLGLGACVTADPFVPGEGTTVLSRVGMVFSFVAIGLAIATVVGGSETLLMALAADLAFLWLVATARHALGR